MSSAQSTVLAIAGVLAGFAIGSFLCVVIERMPVALDEPDEFGDVYSMRPWREVLGGSSRCDGCGSGIQAYDMVPFVSWFVLRGKCRRCGERIPALHPFVELAVPLLGFAFVAVYGWGWRTGPGLWLVPVGVAVAVIDLRTLMVPTRIVWPAFGVTVVLSVVAALVSDEPRWLFGGLVGLLALAGPLALIWFVLPGGMGFGDVRLAVLLGWTVGFSGLQGSWVSAMFLAVATLSLAALIGIASGIVGMAQYGRKAKVPFGPSLVLAALVIAAFSADIIEGFQIG